MKNKVALKQLAKDIGISASYLSQVRHGVRPPSAKLLNNPEVMKLLNIKHEVDADKSKTYDYIIKNTPGATRTPDTRFRKPLLYPTELQGHATFSL
jgi:transcriptional regulator with XRE-family HTH domain